MNKSFVCICNSIYLVSVESYLEEVVEKRPERSKWCDRRKQNNIAKLDVELEIIVVRLVDVFCTLTNVLSCDVEKENESFGIMNLSELLTCLIFGSDSSSS